MNPNLDFSHTADFKGTWSVHTFNRDYLYLSLSAQLAVGTFYLKSPVPQ